jgi:hypothetical protein
MNMQTCRSTRHELRRVVADDLLDLTEALDNRRSLPSPRATSSAFAPAAKDADCRGLSVHARMRYSSAPRADASHVAEVQERPGRLGRITICLNSSTVERRPSSAAESSCTPAGAGGEPETAGDLTFCPRTRGVTPAAAS